MAGQELKHFFSPWKILLRDLFNLQIESRRHRLCIQKGCPLNDGTMEEIPSNGWKLRRADEMCNRILSVRTSSFLCQDSQKNESQSHSFLFGMAIFIKVLQEPFLMAILL